MEKLPLIKTRDELTALIEEAGFIPLFQNSVAGFSVMEITRPYFWWSGEAEFDPWEWRVQISAEGKIAYGKLFSGKAGFISRKWYPLFANFRRKGYDFDALYEDGLASRRAKLIMDLFTQGNLYPSYEIKRLCGFGREGEKGFEGTLTSLQMATYLTVRGFAQKKNKKGEGYGWPVALYSTAEDLFGREHVASRYGEDPLASRDEILARCRSLFPKIPEQRIALLIR